MDNLHLIIVSPDKKLFDGEVDRVTLPGVAGSFTILPQHAPIVTALQSGVIAYITGDKSEKTIEIHSGFAEMSFNRVDVCVD